VRRRGLHRPALHLRQAKHPGVGDELQGDMPHLQDLHHVSIVCRQQAAIQNRDCHAIASNVDGHCCAHVTWTVVLIAGIGNG
jgi:hypothetical protein